MPPLQEPIVTIFRREIQNLTREESSILNYIVAYHGSENPATREEGTKIKPMPDRVCLQEIGTGAVILNHNATALPENREEEQQQAPYNPHKTGLHAGTHESDPISLDTELA